MVGGEGEALGGLGVVQPAGEQARTVEHLGLGELLDERQVGERELAEPQVVERSATLEVPEQVDEAARRPTAETLLAATGNAVALCPNYGTDSATCCSPDAVTTEEASAAKVVRR